MLAYDHVERSGSAATAVLAHPHPAYGGDRYHPIVDALYRRLPLSAVRFDFTSPDPDAAHAAVTAAIDVARGPVVLIGYSFGADAVATVDLPPVLGWFLVAPPLRWADPSAVAAAHDPRPKHLLVPEWDQYSSPDRASMLTAGWRATSVATIAGGDHFLVGRAGEVVAAVLAWLPAVPGLAPPA